MPVQAEAQDHDAPVAFAEAREGGIEEIQVNGILDIAADDVVIGAEHIPEQQLVAVPIDVEGLVKADLQLQSVGLAEEHEYLVFDAARSIGCELDIFIGAEGVDGFDEPDSAYRDEVIYLYARIFEFFCDIDDEAEVMLDKPAAGFRIALLALY